MRSHQITAEGLPLKRLSKTQGHKFSHGHALIVCGGAGQTGAARLAARGALRIGAGLVTLAVPPAAVPEVASQVTAIMLRSVTDHEALENLLRDDRLNALCIGPGLGLDGLSPDLVFSVLKSGRASVLDADALSLIARNRTLFAALHEACVMTPHGGEFARLFPDISERLGSETGFEKSEAAALAAQRAGCTVLLKGADTVIAGPDGSVAAHRAEGARAAPWLATAGSGDVLAGFIAGLLARGFSPKGAAEMAAFLHVEAALEVGPGLIAEDLPEQLPAVFRRLAV